MAVDWFWDKASPHIINHASIYLGLTNRYGDYVWNDGVALA